MAIKYVNYCWGPPGVLGIWGEWLFIFRGPGSTGNYFRGAGKQAHSFGDLVDFELKKVLLPPLGNFADISYLEENF